MAAGLGGGSADAAAALRGLAALWDLDAGALDLPGLALTLGADVPVCLEGVPVVMTGIGETLTPLGPLPKLWAVLVNPNRALSTAAVFAERREDFAVAEDWQGLPAEPEAFMARLAASANDLEPAACRLLPEVAEVLSRLRALPGCGLVRMSGSGATCFGLFRTAEDAGAAASGLTAAMPQWWVVSAPLAR